MNLLHLPHEQRSKSDDYLNFKEIIARIPDLEKFYYFDASALTNAIACEIKQFLVALPEYKR